MWQCHPLLACKGWDAAISPLCCQQNLYFVPLKFLISLLSSGTDQTAQMVMFGYKFQIVSICSEHSLAVSSYDLLF